MNDNLQYAMVCSLCKGKYPEHVVQNLHGITATEVKCSHCGMRFIAPGHFSGMRSVACPAIDLLTLWDDTDASWADLWTFYHEHHVPGYEQPYEELFR